MGDQEVLQRLIQQQIADVINQQLTVALSSNEWLKSLEQKIVDGAENRIVARYINSAEVPVEIINAVKNSVGNLFEQGQIPGLETYVDASSIQQAVDYAVQSVIESAINTMPQDPVWLARVENLINQAVVQRTVASIGSIDITTIIKDRVDENVKQFKQELLTKFSSAGINDQATSCQLTVMDSDTVVENNLTTKDLTVVDTAIVKNLIVKGDINTDNASWIGLSNSISEKTLKSLDKEWKDRLVNQVKQSINDTGISFSQIKVGDELIVDGNQLSRTITDTNIQKVGTLRSLQVSGKTTLNNTITVLNKRVGINTEDPDSALSIWDEEIQLIAGKHKSQEAYIGTGRVQAVNIGVNRVPQVVLGTDGITGIKKLRIAQYQVGHNHEVPNWAGTRGDIMFNSNITVDNPVFAWVCLGAYKWKVIKSVE